MSYKIIPIPGKNTMRDDCPQVTLSGGGNSPLRLTIRYVASYSHEPRLIGEIEFPAVFEFHLVDDSFDYDHYEEHKRDYELGLIEIENSAYVENMASKGKLKHLMGNRFGQYIPESSVKHYRLAFDEYGRFDVVAQEVIVRAIR